jgi:hypothetical protein
MAWVEAHIGSGDWRCREGAIAAFGAVLEGPDEQAMGDLVRQVGWGRLRCCGCADELSRLCVCGCVCLALCVCVAVAVALLVGNATVAPVMACGSRRHIPGRLVASPAASPFCVCVSACLCGRLSPFFFHLCA